MLRETNHQRLRCFRRSESQRIAGLHLLRGSTSRRSAGTPTHKALIHLRKSVAWDNSTASSPLMLDFLLDTPPSFSGSLDAIDDGRISQTLPALSFSFRFSLPAVFLLCSSTIIRVPIS